ncbi:hypothetical protein [Clostridium sp.]|uniref:hypothetical protein n=1 Tax=Clostridium sp. TaxID=1506 RepID=UPI00257FDED6|nr:hypothetical protein [Clostridium sp.]MBE6058231.1 hypothetical protein [Clostridium sp.]
MKYRKKPVVIEAKQWNEDNTAEILNWLGDIGIGYMKNSVVTYIDIKTLEGYITASPKDYIIKGVNGEFYPCKPDIFKKTYELVE